MCTAVMWWRGNCRTVWRRISAWRCWKRHCKRTNRKFWIAIKAVNSPVKSGAIATGTRLLILNALKGHHTRYSHWCFSSYSISYSFRHVWTHFTNQHSMPPFQGWISRCPSTRASQPWLNVCCPVGAKTNPLTKINPLVNDGTREVTYIPSRIKGYKRFHTQNFWLYLYQTRNHRFYRVKTNGDFLISLFGVTTN